jgi:hypothetical protein
VCTVSGWTRQGTDGVLEHDRCEGQTLGWPARRPEALLLRGGWGLRLHSLEATHPLAIEQGSVSLSRKEWSMSKDSRVLRVTERAGFCSQN